jgi:hypothetical protein
MLKIMKNSGRLTRSALYRHPVKLTALLYLKEALLKERYEICESMVSIAKEFGAAQFEIADLLEDPRRKPT